MNKAKFSILSLMLLAAFSLNSIAFAAPGDNPHHQGRQDSPCGGMMLGSDGNPFTKDQFEKLDSLLFDYQQKVWPMMNQKRNRHLELRALSDSGNLAPENARKLTNEIGDLENNIHAIQMDTAKLLQKELGISSFKASKILEGCMMGNGHGGRGGMMGKGHGGMGGSHFGGATPDRANVAE